MKTLKDALEKFTVEQRHYIEKRTEVMEKEVVLLNALREAVTLAEEEWEKRLDWSTSCDLQLKGTGHITPSSLVALIKSLGGSIDLTITLPNCEPIQLSQLEHFLIDESEEDDLFSSVEITETVTIEKAAL